MPVASLPHPSRGMRLPGLFGPALRLHYQQTVYAPPSQAGPSQAGRLAHLQQLQLRGVCVQAVQRQLRVVGVAGHQQGALLGAGHRRPRERAGRRPVDALRWRQRLHAAHQCGAAVRIRPKLRQPPQVHLHIAECTMLWVCTGLGGSTTSADRSVTGSEQQLQQRVRVHIQQEEMWDGPSQQRTGNSRSRLGCRQPAACRRQTLRC